MQADERHKNATDDSHTCPVLAISQAVWAILPPAPNQTCAFPRAPQAGSNPWWAAHIPLCHCPQKQGQPAAGTPRWPHQPPVSTAGRIPTREPACSMQKEWALPLAAQLLQDNQCSSCWRSAAQAHTSQSPPSRWTTAVLGGHRWDCSLHAASRGSSLGIWSQDSEEHDLKLGKGWKMNSYSCIISFYSHRLGSAAHLGSTNQWT